MHYKAISNTGSHFEVFGRERLTLVYFRILKHGDPVGNQRIVGLFSIISILIKCVFESVKAKPSRKLGRKFATTLVFLVAN